MENYVILFDYIKDKISELEKQEDIILLKNNLAIYETNYNLLKENIVNVDMEFVREILNSHYSESLVNQYLKYINILIDLRKEQLTITKRDSLSIKILDFFEEFTRLLEEKIKILKEEIRTRQNTINGELSTYHRYLSYFNISEKKLVTPLSLEELTTFLNFLKKSSLPKENIYDIILGITLENKELLDAKFKERETSKEDTVEEDSLDELLNKITELYEVLKSENFQDTGELEAIKLILQEDKYDFLPRKILYETEPNLNLWRCIYLDLKMNFSIEEKDKFYLNVNKNKEKVKKILEYILDLYQNKFISKDSLKEQFSLLDSNIIQKIEEYEKELESLPSSEKQYLESAFLVYQELGEEGINQFSNNVDKNQILYKIKLLELGKQYPLYQEASTFTTNDLEYAEYIHKVLEDTKEKMLSTLVELDSLKEQLKQPTNSFNPINLLLFLPSASKTPTEVLEEDIKNLTDKFGGIGKKYLKQDLKGIEERLLSVRFLDLDGYEEREILTNKRGNNYYMFDKNSPFNVFRYRGNASGGGRVPYMKIEVSDANQETLKQYYQMDNLDSIYLILSLDGSVRGNKDYVERVHTRVVKEKDYLLHIQEIFKNDFTKETFEEAKQIIENGIKVYASLKESMLQESQEELVLESEVKHAK